MSTAAGLMSSIGLCSALIQNRSQGGEPLLLFGGQPCAAVRPLVMEGSSVAPTHQAVSGAYCFVVLA